METLLSDPTCSAISPDGKQLIVAGLDHRGMHTAQIWSIAEQSREQVLIGHEGAIGSICMSPDGATLATAGSDNTIRLWDPEFGIQRCLLDSHSAAVTCLVFSANGNILLSGSEDSTVRIWRSGRSAAAQPN